MPPYHRYLLPYLCGALMAASVAGAAEQAPSPAEPAVRMVNPLDKQNRLLAQELPAAANWLTAGSEEFLALWEPWSNSKQKGVVLMLPAQGQTANGSGSFSYLRRKLPELGWATLSLALPAADIPAALRLPSENPGDQVETTNEQEGATHVPAEPELQTDQRIASALAFLQRRAPGQRVVLLGENTGAAHGMAYLDSLPTGAPVTAVVLLDARNGLPGRDLNLADVLAEQSMPVLDVYTGDTPGDISAAKARETAAEVGQLSAYRQIELATSTPFSTLPTPTTRYVEGFLRSISED
jgi:hypothetical protein